MVASGSNSSEGSVKSEICSGISTITFFHPASNSLPENILNKISDAIRGAGEDDDVRVIILKSIGDLHLHC